MATRKKTGDALAFGRGRYRLMAALLIVLAIAGAAGCVAADVL